jgi:hypothetical protein
LLEAVEGLQCTQGLARIGARDIRHEDLSGTRR